MLIAHVPERELRDAILEVNGPDVDAIGRRVVRLGHLQFVQRESEIKRIYYGSPDAAPLLKFYNVDYAVVGPQERLVMQAVNERFFSQFEKVGQVGEYSLYKVRRE